MREPVREFTVAELQARGWLLVEDGNHGEYRPRPEEFGSGDWAFIRAADLDDSGNVLFSQAQRINDAARKRIRKGVGAVGDVLLSHKGTVGKVAFVRDDAPPFVCSPQTTFWRSLNPSAIDRRFLYFFLRSAEFQQQLDAREGETDMAPYVSLTAQRQLRVALPVIETQRMIANMLAALDDMIVLNRRMNRTLEATAATLFGSWFVDFDPVRAKAEGYRTPGLPRRVYDAMPDALLEDDGVLLPRGWHRGAFSDIARLRREQVPATAILADTPYIAMDDMPRRSIALESWSRASRLDSAKARYSCGDVLFGKLRPYFHKVGIAPNEGVCSTELLVIQPVSSEWYGLVACVASSTEFVDYASAAAEGTRMPRVSWNYLARYLLPLPPPELAREFSALVAPLFDRIIANAHENHSLATLRDNLLPQLLSGALRVRDRERTLAAIV